MCGESEVWVIAKSRNNRGSYPEDEGGVGVLQQGHCKEGMLELEVQDLGRR